MKSLPIFTIFLICISLSNYCKAQDISNFKNASPFSIRGTFGLGIGTYHASGIPARQRNFSYTLNGAPAVSIYGVSFPFSVTVSDQQRSYSQPFNQYGISPSYKWITLHAGWRNLEFSPFSLAGHNFLGGGLELNPGKFRFGFVYGRFNKAIEESPIQSLALAQQPAYKRMVYSAKIGLGTERNHFDLIFLKGKDDAHSLQPNSITSGLTPAENFVASISTKFSLFKGLTFELDGSGSLFTKNILADTVQNLDLEQFSFIKKLITINSSSYVSTALQSSIAYHGNNFSIKTKYRRIDPNYTSMGAYYFETDVQNYTLEGFLKILKNTVQLSGSFGVQNDNVLKNKQVESIRKIGSANLSFQKPKYGLDIRYTNYGITQDKGFNPVLELYRVARTNHNLSTVARFSHASKTLLQSVVLSANLQSLRDLNNNTSQANESNTKLFNISYQINLIPSATGFNLGFNLTDAKMSLGNSKFYGTSFSFNKALSNGKWQIGTGINYQIQSNFNTEKGKIFSSNVQSSYQIGKKNAVNLSLNYLNNKSDNVFLPSFRELRTNFGIVQAF